MTSAARPNLSFCTMTTDPVATASLLDLLRPVADEVVVAVDSRYSDRIGALRGVDRLFVFDFQPPIERTVSWMYAQCSGRWRLRLDTDEIPSRSLLDSLGELTAVDDVTHYWIPRRWLYRNTDTYLADPPWFPDFQLRLILNLPAVDTPEARVHELAPIAGAGRFVEHAIYHSDLIDNSLDARRRKAASYERLQPGVRTDGLAVNAGYYLPELRNARVESVPDEDRALTALRASLHDPDDRVGDARTMLGRVAPSEIDRFWPGRTIPPEAYRARVEAYGPPPVLAAGLDRTVFVRVANDGTETWPRGTSSLPEIRLGYRFRTPSGGMIDEGRRSAFPASMPPGQSSLVPLQVHGPDEPGDYVLEIDVVHEHVRWFDATCELEVSVVRPRRVLVVAGYSPFAHVGDDAIVRAHLHRLALTVPDVETVLLAPEPGPIARRFGHPTTTSIHQVLYAGIDVHGDAEEAGARVRARIDELVDDAARFRAGTRSADPERDRFFALVAGSEAVVFASGGALASRYSPPELWPQMATAIIAGALGTRVLFSGVSVGPIDEIDRGLVRRGFEAADAIVLRDRGLSAQTLRDCGVEAEVVEEPDPASALLPASPNEVEHALALAGLAAGTPFVVVSLRATAGGHADLAALAALLDHLAAGPGLAVVLVPHCTQGPHDDDREPMEKLREQLASHVRVHALDPMPREDLILGIVSAASLAVGSRYHLTVFAASAGVPAIGCYEDEYTHRKLQGAAEFAPSQLVAVVAADCGADVLIATADRLLGEAPRQAMRNSDLRALASLTEARPK